MKTIGIIGNGFVGGTAYKAFSKLDGYKVLINDKDESKCKNSFEDTAKCDLVFIAVPTPSNFETGECYTHIVSSCVAQVREYRKDNLIVIKSTVPPGTTKKLNFSYGRVCFNPEFLTEANADADFKNLQYQILGMAEKEEKADELHCVFYDCYKQGILDCSIFYNTDSSLAEMVKYTKNCYLATRLSFFNEIKQICDAVGVNYNQMKELAGLDNRVGNHYNEVNEDNPGWGLSCLPKDLNALKFVAEKLGLKPLVLDAAWKKNLEVRKFRDWETMSKATLGVKDDVSDK